MPTISAMPVPAGPRSNFKTSGVTPPAATPTTAADRDVHTALARASAATGVDFGYLLAQAKLESGLDPSARASTSSAAGLHQFLSGTWLETLDRHGAAHGLGWADDAISRRGGRASIADPQMRAEVMALRYDPTASSLMAAELARDNAQDLRGFLGREPDHAELYLAHFMGSGGAREFLGALHANPGQSAAAQFPKAAAANRAMFYDGAQARSLEGMMALIRSKVAGASEGGFGALASSGLYGVGGGSSFGAFDARFASSSRTASGDFPRSDAAKPASARPTMAETLRSTFGTSDNASGQFAQTAGRRVDEAYAKFRTFGL